MSVAMAGILLVLLSTAIEAVGEIVLKLSRLVAGRGRRVRLVLAGVAIFAVQMCVYTASLKFLDLAPAFALTSLSFVMVALLSRLILGEAVTPIRWVGIWLIVAGTLMIGADT